MDGVKYPCYPIHQSSLYGIKSKKKLASLLNCSLHDIKQLAKVEGNYKVWTTSPRRQDILVGISPKGDGRRIQQPIGLLDKVHRRIAKLLGRMEKPGYVISATKGLSYVDNAARHQNDSPGFKVDIKNFYQSISRKRVRKFFLDVMGCSDDVGAILASICCFGGHLPTGSSISPVLSYFVCRDIFDEIFRMAFRRDVNFTLYIDDMMFSGEGANRLLMRKVIRVLSRNGFVGHKVSLYSAGEVKVITGVAISGAAMKVTSRRWKRMRVYQDALKRQVNYEDAILVTKSLAGQYYEASRIVPELKKKADAVFARLGILEHRRDAKTPYRKVPCGRGVRSRSRRKIFRRFRKSADEVSIV